MLDGRVDLNADLLLVLLEALKLDRELILARNEAGETIGALEIGDSLERSIPQSVAAEIHDNARQRTSLLRNVGNDFAPDATALSRTGKSDKEGN